MKDLAVALMVFGLMIGLLSIVAFLLLVVPRVARVFRLDFDNPWSWVVGMAIAVGMIRIGLWIAP